MIVSAKKIMQRSNISKMNYPPKKERYMHKAQSRISGMSTLKGLIDAKL